MQQNNLDKYKSDLDSLLNKADIMYSDLKFRHAGDAKLSKEEKDKYKKVKDKFEGEYQNWFTEAYQVIKQLIPDRLQEFDGLYKTDPKRKSYDSLTFSIQDWLMGARATEKYDGTKKFDEFASVFMRFQNQINILTSAKIKFESRLFDIKSLLQADLFDSELEISKELLKKGFQRASGVICGVIIEKHLLLVCNNHSITVAKKHPTISDFNDLLKSNDTIDVITWRFIQRLGDLRNICGHNKESEPTKENVTELIEGTDKLIKSLF